jgi:acetyl esterase/lipase
VALGALVGTAVFSLVSPWLPALLIRSVFEKGAADTVQEMLPYVPSSGFTSRYDVPYGGRGEDTTLDVFTADGGRALPTVVWIHGGAWISGDKRDVAPYLQMIAAEGYTTIGVNYTIGPEATYPTAVDQLNDALGYILENAAELRVDPQRIVLAGDSAGSQLASELATITTSPDFAATAGIEPALSPEQLRGVVLNCGVYDLDALAAGAHGLIGWGFKSALWAYTGDRDWSDTSAGQQMSTLDFVTDGFPPAYISGGNGDALTDGQSKPLVEKLTGLGVEVTPVFWPADTDPALPHEYQFHLDYPQAQQALQATKDFLAAVTAD